MTTPREPSMEDILASIKRVIAEEKEIRSGTVPAQPEAPRPFEAAADDQPDDGAGDDDVLELGPAMETAAEPFAPLSFTGNPQDDGEQAEDADGDAHEAADAPFPAPRQAAPSPMPIPPVQPLLDESVAAGSRQRLAQLQDLAASPPPRPSTGNPFEDLVRDMLRPMLKAWLDEHLPEIVDAHVRREVSRITGRDL